jgi:hypothetical protein
VVETSEATLPAEIKEVDATLLISPQSD